MKVEDFLLNDRFVQWVLQPNEELDQYWNQWIADHPDDTGALHEATALIQNIYVREAKNLQEDALVSIKDRAWHRIKKSVQQEIAAPKPRSRFFMGWWQSAAAVLILAILSLVFLYKPQKSSNSSRKYAYNGVEYENLDKYTSKKNISGTANKVYLPDGSKVILNPGARIEYETLLTGSHRIVTLKGSAFFDVAKDPTRPFVIHTTKADVTVLGTSFKILEDPRHKNVTVAVRTGKVMVSGTGPSKPTVQLSPGEQVSVNSEKETLTKRVVSDSSYLAAPAVKEERFVYDNENVTIILKELQKIYGVKIDFDEQAFKDCFLTTNLTSGSLFNKLDILTVATGAVYMLQDGKVQIQGGKCN